MKKIGLISDTHGYIDPKFSDVFSTCDEIWHAGDIGTVEVLHYLEQIARVRAVYGNIDGTDIRSICPEYQQFLCEGLKVRITHIGGYPGRYARGITEILEHEKPGLFIAGHSHILKVMYDKKHDLLYMNPGAAGKTGLHRVRTVLRFTVSDARVQEAEVIELGLRSR